MRVFCAAFEKPLPAPEFFSHGDALGFGLRYVYQVEHVCDLKETTRLSIRGVHALWFGPTMATRLPTWKADQSSERRNVVRFSPFWVGIKKVEITL